MSATPSIYAGPFYEAEHEDFRGTARAFLEREVVPHHDQWEKDGIVPREVWAKAGEAGLLCFDVPEEYGGPGIDDFRFNAVLTEEVTRIGASGLGFSLHSDIVVPYLVHLGTDEQKRRWLPGCVSGEIITAIAMTEPGAGSDLQGIRTTAVDKGDHYVLNGSKIFITNGINADLVVVVAKTEPDKGAHGISLLVVERGMEGFSRGRNLDKMGMKAQDTAELVFDNVVVPKENLLGEVNGGFIHLMTELPRERVSVATIAVAAIERVPLTRNGKLDVKALPAIDRSSGAERIAPEGLVQEQIAQAWASTLGLELDRISVTDSFFDLGGDSIRAVVLAGAIRQAGYDLGIRDIFDKHPTTIYTVNNSSTGLIDPTQDLGRYFYVQYNQKF